jgi:hypothetical protein
VRGVHFVIGGKFSFMGPSQQNNIAAPVVESCFGSDNILIFLFLGTSGT